MDSTLLIVRLSETTLKGKNRFLFEDRLAGNAAAHLKQAGTFTLTQQPARLLVRGGTAAQQDTAQDILRGLPGVANLSRAKLVESEPDRLEGHVVDYMAEVMAALPPEDRRLPFRVEVERKEKRYPLTSPELAGRLGAALLARHPRLKVNLEHPELTLHVEIWEGQAAVYTDKVPGPGGLAVGVSGRVLALLSGGIDSPVAAHMMMTRGCRVAFLNFHSYPYIGEQSKEKVVGIVRHLARYQPETVLHIAPFAPIQEDIRDHSPEGLRTVLYRRSMNRVAGALAARTGALALVSGDELGQVASQTLENLRAVGQAATLPVLQPLIGMHKHHIVHQARAIGTFPISIQPFPDCCTLFQPARPDTRARLDKLAEVEAGIPLAQLEAQCLEGLETLTFGPEYTRAGW
ncbi:MAG: tRNA 4-thiouridine(8) synthase ThiI [Deltaproteobacteria bacterium]|nr:tRNA 4-thiouridine(8) synthase ThiI [Deltaproteobacteria bacterium]